MQPEVSVIMPVYNAEKYVGQAIESILRQSYEDFELIMVDDCPTDATMDIVRSYQDSRIRLIHNKSNRGISYSRNIALENSRGKYIAIMDDDDISVADRLEKEVSYLEAHPNIGIVAGGARIIDEMGNVLREPVRVLNNPLFIKAVFLFRNVYQNSEVLLRRDLIEKYRIRYRENWMGMEDYRFWVECSKVIPMSGISDTVLLYRQRADSEGMQIKRDMKARRAEKYAEIQRFSLAQSGFHLQEEQLQFLTGIYCEQDQKCRGWHEITEFYAVLYEIVRQAIEMGLDNCEEIKIVCRQILCQVARSTTALFG